MIGRPVRFYNLGDRRWHLYQFEGGRYFASRAKVGSGTKMVCALGRGHVIIKSIFDDHLNGGRYFSADIFCSEKIYSAPLNNWSDDYIQGLEFL